MHGHRFKLFHVKCLFSGKFTLEIHTASGTLYNFAIFMSVHVPAGTCILVASASPIHVPPICILKY